MKCNISFLSYLELRFRLTTQIARFIWPTWGPLGSCRPQMGPIFALRTLLSGHRWTQGMGEWFYPIILCDVIIHNLITVNLCKQRGPIGIRYAYIYGEDDMTQYLHDLDITCNEYIYEGNDMTQCLRDLDITSNGTVMEISRCHSDQRTQWSFISHAESIELAEARRCTLSTFQQ